ncbi:MAG: amino acid permease [Bacteroidetes bacterium]|nr:amino acid permease [Bacteroidota bacterium]MCL6099080.1 amino acid permease [Bacteroidota bacterium]
MSLKRKLTAFDLTMIAIGSTIGSGIFFTPSLIAKSLNDPLLILFAWLVGGLMALSGALTFSELGSMFPEAGGVYVYLNKAYGELAGFLYGWAYFLVVNTGGIAALAIAFSTYFGYFIYLTLWEIKLVGVAGIVFVTIINIVGVKAAGIFSDIFTVLKLIGIIGLILVGFIFGSGATTNFFESIHLSQNAGSAFAVAMVGVLWSYGGWQHATFTAGEAINPKKDLPRAMITAAVAVTLIYILTNIAYMFLMTPGEIGSTPTLAADAVQKVLGAIGGSLIAIAIFISTFGTTGIYTLTAPRIYYAMATDKIFFPKIAELHPKYRTPVYAIVVQSIWAITLIMFWGTFENLIAYVVFTDWIFFGMTAASIFIFRRKLPQIERPYSTFGYPVTPLFFTAMAVWFVVNTLIEKPQQAWAGLLFLGIGIPVYYFWKRKR